ncbi:MAG: class IV adenylate cyclase [Candidatus Odinarchaeia archaeon]
MIEVEVKIKLDDKNRFLENIKKFGAIKLQSQVEEDIYFQHPLRDFSKTDEALRIRKVDGKFTLTYKGPKLGEMTKTREEINVYIEDGERMKNLLVKLGFKHLQKITKKREIYRLGEIEIFVDHVDGLGDYVEFEILTTDKNEISLNEKKIFNLLSQVGLGDEKLITKSYLELILERTK